MTLQGIKTELAELKTLLSNLVAGKTPITAEERINFEKRLSDAEAAVTGQADASAKAIADKDAAIKDLEGKLKAAEDKAGSQASTIKDLEGKVEAGLKKANEVIAAQGLPAGSAPAGEVNAQPGTAAKSLLDQLNAITDPKERSAFIEKNFDALYKSAQGK